MTISLPSARIAPQSADAGKVDEMLRRRQAELHHRYQAVPARERPRLLAEVGKKRHRFRDGLRAMIFERSRYHDILPAPDTAGAILQVFIIEKETF